MPELPEVEFSRHQLEELLVGKEITDVVAVESGGGNREGLFDEIVFEAATVPDARTLKAALVGFVCAAVRRKGKQMWWELGKGSNGAVPTLFPLMHYGMTGSLVVKGARVMAYKSFSVDESKWPPKFTKCEIVFADKTRVAFCDPRRLGRIKLRADPPAEPPIKLLAPDPLFEMPSKEAFAAKVAKYSAPLKAVLLDQNKVICGVGNWMADEIAFQARLHPESSCNALSREQCDLVHDSITKVVEVACRLLKDGKELPEDWLFHRRWGKGKGKGNKYGDLAIEFSTVGGRTTAVVPALQPRAGASVGEGKRSSKCSNAKVVKAEHQEAQSEAGVGHGPAEEAEPKRRRATGVKAKGESTPSSQVGQGGKRSPASGKATAASKKRARVKAKVDPGDHDAKASAAPTDDGRKKRNRATGASAQPAENRRSTRSRRPVA